jgi:hypothetical protein
MRVHLHQFGVFLAGMAASSEEVVGMVTAGDGQEVE